MLNYIYRLTGYELQHLPRSTTQRILSNYKKYYQSSVANSIDFTPLSCGVLGGHVLCKYASCFCWLQLNLELEALQLDLTSILLRTWMLGALVLLISFSMRYYWEGCLIRCLSQPASLRFKWECLLLLISPLMRQWMPPRNHSTIFAWVNVSTKNSQTNSSQRRAR